MNKLGIWLENNSHLFYQPCPTKTSDENFADERKTIDKLFKEAEHKLDKRYKRYLKRDKEQIKKMIGKQFNYNQKIVFIDAKIEKDILFFKNNYYDYKKQVYKLKKDVT